MALTEWYEVLDKHNAGGVNLLNVYHVIRDNGGVTSTLVAEAFEDSILTPLLALQDDRYIHTSIEVRNLATETDFHVRAPVPDQGTRVVQAGFAQFYACSIQFNRTRNDMKHGQKRFAVGVESDASDSGWAGAFLTEMETMRDPLLTDWERAAAPGVAVCRYGIIQRVCDVEGQEPCLKYRLPETDTELEFFIPTSAIIRDRIRSQVSRKRLI